MNNYNKLIFELSKPGKEGYVLPQCDVPNIDINDLIPEKLKRKSNLNLPQVSEVEIVRHYTALANKNYCVDKGIYPLGSCTMKYNPKVNEEIARYEGFEHVHPLQNSNDVQGTLQIMYELQKILCEIAGMDYFTLQPAAGAHGELTGLMIISEYYKKRGEYNRNKVIIPDSAHGTNPCSASCAGFKVVEIKSKDGLIDLDSLKQVLDNDVAALMLTNPNTLGMFEKDIIEISKLVHKYGGLLYYDGANMNAINGIVRPGDMGFDVMHLNLHKSFSTPHGGGGPGSGPVGVKNFLKDFLPVPIIDKNENGYILDYKVPYSIGKVSSFYGNISAVIKAYSYIVTMGGNGLKKASELAVLNSNYIKEKLKIDYDVFNKSYCMHECVFSGLKNKKTGINTLNIAKAIIDSGYHPPTIYFPTIIKECIMIEPTETESLESLDKFIETLVSIAKLAESYPEEIKKCPLNAPIRKLDETNAARNLKLKY